MAPAGVAPDLPRSGAGRRGHRRPQLPVRVDQQVAPQGTAVGGAAYQKLGSYTFTAAGPIRIVLGADANGPVVADAVRVAPALPAILDDNAVGGSQTGTWSVASGGGTGGEYRVAAAGTGSSAATWQAGAPGPGLYLILPRSAATGAGQHTQAGTRVRESFLGV